MTTTSQIEANRQNSLYSTGPKTEAGKAASRLNATSHGFNAADPVLPGESRDEFDGLLERHKSDFAPRTAHEEFLVEQVAAAQWKLARLQRIEYAMLAGLDDQALVFTDKDKASAFARLERYRASLERTFNRSVRELRASRKIQNEANSTEAAEKKFGKLVDRMVDAAPPGLTFEPRLVPVAAGPQASPPAPAKKPIIIK